MELTTFTAILLKIWSVVILATLQNFCEKCGAVTGPFS